MQRCNEISAEMFGIGQEGEWGGTLHIFGVPFWGQYRLNPMSISRIRDINVTVTRGDVVSMHRRSNMERSEISRTDDERLMGFSDYGLQ